MLTVLTRHQWGARTDLPRRGHLIGHAHRTEVFMHHTVVVDAGATANEWEDLAEVRRKMRQLQTSRPELGLDVPYTMVAFCMADGDLVLCEGRGLERTGAHTPDHNRSALGIAFQGDFHTRPPPAQLDAQLAALGHWLRRLRTDGGFVNLGSVRPDGREVWGHREAKTTSCPGDALFARLPLIRFLDEDDDAMMDRETWKKVQAALQRLEPPLYAGKPIDGLPGQNTNTAVRAFERRVGLTSYGVLGALNDPTAGIWPATRELLFALAFAGGGV